MESMIERRLVGGRGTGGRTSLDAGCVAVLVQCCVRSDGWSCWRRAWSARVAITTSDDGMAESMLLLLLLLLPDALGVRGNAEAQASRCRLQTGRETAGGCRK